MTRHRWASQHDPCDHTSPLYKRHRDRFNQWASCELCRNSGGCIIWLQFACCFLALVQVWDNVPERSTGLPFLQASNFSYSTSQDKQTGASTPKTRSSHPAVLTEPTRDRRMDTAKPQQQAYRETVMTKQPFLESIPTVYLKSISAGSATFQHYSPSGLVVARRPCWSNGSFDLMHGVSYQRSIVTLSSKTQRFWAG